MREIARSAREKTMKKQPKTTKNNIKQPKTTKNNTKQPKTQKNLFFVG